MDRLPRPVFAVALLYLRLVARGAQAVQAGARHLVERVSDSARQLEAVYYVA